ncbi:MAG TPA: sugar phosphate isomerase/epimerase family protein [Clostridia bacterium]|nr:sugar phosphate isomerase/epimerase family protein [Clostridia bacterium]
MDIGVALMGGTFMPEFKGGTATQETAFDRLVTGYRLAMAMGYDYIEASAGEVLALSAQELEKLVEMRKTNDFALRYVNSFVRADLKICTASTSALEDYANEAVRRVAMLGASVIVFGSGVARNHPESMPHTEGMQKFVRFLGICSKAAKKHGIKIALEPLNRTETNILNSVAEGAELVHWLNSPEIVLLADAFHMDIEGETAEVILDNEDIISHLHISEAPGRVCPGKFGGEYLIKLGKDLREAGFCKDATVECCFDSFEKEGPEALRFIKEKMLWGLN